MEREIDLAQVSDGRRYQANDLVKADCQGCAGCSACCRDMGNSVLLDPYDLYRLKAGAGLTFEAMMAAGQIELNLVEGIILPNLAMNGPGAACAFLDSQGRCSIHAHRPGFCRLFPLGRLYEDGSFSYFLQVHECRNQNRTKVKVKKWMDTPEFGLYEDFVCRWHYFLKEISRRIVQKGPDAPQAAKAASMYVLNEFYIKPYDTGLDFYSQFEERMKGGLPV